MNTHIAFILIKIDLNHGILRNGYKACINRFRFNIFYRSLWFLLSNILSEMIVSTTNIFLSIKEVVILSKNCKYICKLLSILFLFVGVSSSHSRIFHSYWDVTNTDEGLQILTNTRLSWPLRIEGSFKWHTYCDTRDIRLYGHIQGPVTFTLLYSIDWIVFYAVLAIFQPFHGDAPVVNVKRLAVELSLPVLAT